MLNLLLHSLKKIQCHFKIHTLLQARLDNDTDFPRIPKDMRLWNTLYYLNVRQHLQKFPRRASQALYVSIQTFSSAIYTLYEKRNKSNSLLSTTTVSFITQKLVPLHTWRPSLYNERRGGVWVIKKNLCMLPWVMCITK